MRFFCFVTLLLFTGCLLPARGFAQAKEDRVFKAIVVDSLDKTPLENCTVSLQTEGSKKFITDEDGSFSLKLKADTAFLFLQHIGYAEKRFALLQRNKKSIDTILLSPSSTMMEGVVVKAKLPLVVVRGDTTEYNVDSSMFEPFDVVEDFVKRLPGLEIDAQGKMTFHGKPITRILVDGEDLFGGDPNFSMKKLPAGMVAKIQVMDTKTLEQIFNNIPPDGEDKTLNIKLKAGSKTFGNAAAAAGTKNNLEADANISRFNENKRLSLTGGYNSSNKTGLFKVAGGPTSSDLNAGVNYGDKIGKLRFNASYAFNQSTSSNETYRERTQLITTDTSFFTKAASRFNNAYGDHRVNLNANLWIDSSSILDATLSFNKTKNNNENSSSSLTSENGLLRNESRNNTTANGKGQNVSASVTWRKYLNRKGRNLFLSAQTNGGDQQSELLSQSTNTYFVNGLPASGDTLNRETKNQNKIKSYSANFTYTEPLAKNLRLNLTGNYNWSQQNNDRMIYNLDSATHKATFDSLYSATVISTDATKSAGASLHFTNQKWNVSSGLTTLWQRTVRSLQKENLQQDLLRYSPTLNAAYAVGKGKMLRAAFSAVTVQPSVDQLRPVPDNSNPLYIRLGNPALRTAFSQNYLLSYNYSNNRTTLMASAAYAPVSNQIVNATTYDEYRRVTSQYINVQGMFNARANLSFSKLYQQDKSFINWNTSSGFAYGRQVYFQSNKRYDSRNYSVNATLSFSKHGQGVRSSGFTLSLAPMVSRNWTPADKTVLNTARLSLSPMAEGSCKLFRFVYLTTSYRLWYNRLDYHSLLRRNDEYSLHTLNNSLRFQVMKRWYVQTALSYQYNTQAPDGADKGQFNSNLSVNVQVAKGRGQISVTAFDLLATKTALQRVVSENYIEDVQTNNLRNYFTLRLQWGFSKLERRQKAPIPDMK